MPSPSFPQKSHRPFIEHLEGITLTTLSALCLFSCLTKVLFHKFYKNKNRTSSVIKYTGTKPREIELSNTPL